MKKRLISFIMIAVLGVSRLSVQATVDTPMTQAESCEHHQTHTLDCGYVQAVEAASCAHTHEAACYVEKTVCLHNDHDDACGYGQPVEENPCSHLCSQENGCITLEEQCIHTSHDDVCGYEEAVGEIPCTFACTDCVKEEDNPDKQSIESTVKEESQASRNALPGSSDEASVSQNETSAYDKEGSNQENVTCTCTSRCKEGDIEADCTLCSGEAGGINACQGKELLLKSVAQPAIMALTTADIIYVSSNGVDTASGTQEYPVKTIEKALTLVNAGGTIQILDNVTTQQISGDEPLRITKNITIRGGSLTVNLAGIVLGADVTFEGISLSFINSVRNAIVANGYSLTLNGVQDEGTFPIHLFCGDIKEYNSTGGLPASGGNASITITGSNSLKGDIFAGSLHVGTTPAAYTGTANITLSPGTSGFTGTIYAHGATEPTGAGNQGMIADSNTYTVTGAVTVNLTNGISTVYGKTGGTNNAAITFTDNGRGYIYTPTLYDIGSLSVNTGSSTPHLAPSALSNFSAGAAVTVPAGTRLDLTKLGDLGIASLSGGGTLIMNPTQTLTITGAVLGNTQIAITGIDYYGDSTGEVTDGHTYINAPNSTDNSFALLDSPSGDAQPLIRGGDGSWVADISGGGGITITDFSLGNATVTDTDTQGKLSITVTYSEENIPQDEFLLLYANDITVQVNSVEAPYSDDAYAYIDSTTGLELYFGADGNDLVVKSGSTFTEGDYTISVTIPEAATTGGTAITASGKLKVIGAGSSTVTGYGLYVQGTQVTDTNKDDILGDGKVSFTPSSGTAGTQGYVPATLTLDGATITHNPTSPTLYSDDTAAISYTDTDTLKIITTADSTVTAQSKVGIYSTGPLVFGGTGLLEVVGVEQGVYGMETITVDTSAKLNATSNGNKGAAIEGDSVSISGAQVCATGLYGIRSAIGNITIEQNSVIEVVVNADNGIGLMSKGGLTIADSEGTVGTTGSQVVGIETDSTITVSKSILKIWLQENATAMDAGKAYGGIYVKSGSVTLDEHSHMQVVVNGTADTANRVAIRLGGNNAAVTGNGLHRTAQHGSFVEGALDYGSTWFEFMGKQHYEYTYAGYDGHYLSCQDGCLLQYKVLQNHLLGTTYTADENTDIISVICTACGGDMGGFHLQAPRLATYDGTAKTATVYPAGNTTPGGDISSMAGIISSIISYSQAGTPLQGAPVNAGDYTASITLGTATVSVDFTIDRIAPAISDFQFSAPANLSYDGTVKAASVTTTRSGMGAITAYYYPIGSSNTTQALNAGAYTVKIAVEQGLNYEASTVLLTDPGWVFTIAKAPLTIKANDQSVIKNGTIQTGTNWVQVTGLGVGDQLGSIDLASTDTDKLTTSGTITPSNVVITRGGTGNQNTNYNITYQTGILTVTEHTHRFTYQSSGNTITATCSNDDGHCTGVSQTITLTAPGATIEYDGAAKAATVSGTIDGQATPVLMYEGNNYPASAIAPSDVGSYTAFITVGGQRAQVSFVITPKNITQAGARVGSFDTLTYTGNPQTPKATVSVGGVPVEGSWSSVTNVGEQSTFTATGNYTGTLTADVGMAKADPVVTAPIPITNLTYTGQSQTLIQGGATTGGTLQYQTNGRGWSTALPTGVGAGTYTISYKVEGSTNYNSKVGFATVSVTIGKAPQEALSIASRPVSPVYGDSFTLSTAGGSGTGGVTWTVTDGANNVSLDAASGVGKVMGVNGTVSVTATKAGDDNYQETSAMWTFTPGKKQVVATANAANKTYDGTTTATVTVQVSQDQLISGDSLTVEGVRGSFSDGNVGSGKTVTVDASAATWKGTNAYCYQVTIPNTATANITKSVATPVAGILEITNGHAGNYTYDLGNLLAPLTGSSSYGAVEYTLGNINLPNYYTGGATVNKDILTLPILEVASDKEETVGTITVSMASENYDFTASTTITVKSSNKDVPQGSPVLSSNSLTYGDLLSKISLSGSMKTVDGAVVAGTFAWDTPDVRLDAGIRQGAWTFTPADTSKYLIVSGISDITVNPAKGQASVTMTGWTYGQTASDPTANSTTNSNVSALFSYKKKGDPDTAYTGNKPQDVGTYVVRAVFAANNNYTQAVATAEFTIQGMAQSAPGVVVESGKTYNSITLQAIGNNPLTGAGVEYSKDGGTTWQADPVFTGLSASTAYRFTARYAAIGNYAASAHGPVTEIITGVQPGAGSDGSGGSTGGGTTEGGTNSTAATKPEKGNSTGNTLINKLVHGSSGTATGTTSAGEPSQAGTTGRNTRSQTDTTTDRGQSVSGTLRAGAESINIDAQVNERIARLTLPEKNILDELIQQVKEDDFILDLSSQQPDVYGVEISIKILSAIAQAKEEGGSLTLYLPSGGITLDGTALQSVCRQAQGDSLQIVVEKVGTTALNREQGNAVSSMDVREGVDIYIYCISSNKRIGEFEGGMAEVWIPFELPAGTRGEDFGIYHVSENGDMERLETRYEAAGINGYLVGDTSHFSDFVVIYEKAQEVSQELAGHQETDVVVSEAQSHSVETDRTAIPVVPIVTVLALTALAGTGVYLTKKKQDRS